MPRLAKSEKEKRDDDLLACIDGNITRCHLSREEFYRRTGFSASTFNRRIKNPDTFTRGEMHRMCVVFNISMITLLAGDMPR